MTACRGGERVNEFDPESQFKEWKGDFSQSEEAREMAAWAAKVREQEEKDAWIAQRKAQERKALWEKTKQWLLIALPIVLALGTLILLGIPGFTAIRAGDAAEAGDYARAAGLYEWAGKWSLFDKIFEASKKAEENRTMQRLLNCSAGAADWEIPKSAVRLTGTAEGRSGPITVELIADRDRIWRITVTEHSEQEEIGGQAARQLPERIYRAQTVDVDAVTGATISSQAICRAASQALNSDEAWAAGIYAWKFGAITPMPPPSPTPGPTPEELKVFYYETELEEFTEKVGESVRLRVRAYPEADFADAVYQWSVSDPRRLTITVSEDTRTCTVLCLKHEPGPVTLTVSCNGVEKQITVYTRK